jgi:Protein of unknown function (DUF3619)
MSKRDLNSNQNIDIENLDIQGKQIACLLDEHANRLSMRTLKQLENGRGHAVKAHQQQISGVCVNGDGTLSSISSWAEHHRVAMTGFVLATIVTGFFAMQSFKHQEASDAFLLGADLPPEAFVDRGFEPFLNDSHAKL